MKDPDTSASEDARQEAGWVHHALWWHVYPLGFAGADTTGADRQLAHRLQHLTQYLDYAVRLGASGIALGPIFESASHGYDTIDHYRIDPRLGEDGDVDEFIEQAHQRGLRVMLDGVFNHVGREFPAFTAVLADADAPKANWFTPDASGDYATFEGHPGLIVLNHANHEVADYVTDVMTHWLDRGADGWRLDAAYAVPADFWATVLPRVRAAHPAAYLLGEVIHGDYAEFVAASGLDSVTQYELWKAIWSSFNDRNLFELSWALQRHNGWLKSFVPFTFVGNHDVTRVASRLDDARHLPHALVVLLSIGGTPSIYYGDEQGMTGLKEDRAGGDDAVRPAFPALSDQLDPLPAAATDAFRLHQDLIGMRRRHPWLHRARTETVELNNEQLIYDCRDGSDSIRVYLNLGDAELVHDAVRGQLIAGAANLSAEKSLIAPHGWAIVELGS